ncbi:MAG: hypothetical protein QOI74_956, partial [Micromonosporaceae bacterium]|nr:hypothetical protein [Micromonosporaceae bacterium]
MASRSARSCVVPAIGPVRRPWRARLMPGAVAVLATSLVANMVWVPPSTAAPSGPPTTPPAKSVPVSPVKPKAAAEPIEPGEPVVTTPDRAALPAAGTADVVVSGGSAVVGGLPVTLDVAAGNDSLRPGRRLPAAGAGSLSAVRVQVADQAAATAVGISGVLIGLAPDDPAAGSARVRASFDYGQFANAFGADYGARLRLVELPACALTAPSVPACRQQTVLTSDNSESAATVSAELMISDATVDGVVSPTVVALAAGTTSGGATFEATSLSAAYSWTAGGQSGGFTYSYPLKVPASLGGPGPDLNIAYSSDGVDAQTLSQNGQTSWVGEGWDLQTGFVERSYRPCAQDGLSTGDQCWFSSYNATMVFGGHSMRLVRDRVTGLWHGGDDDGSRVELLYGSPQGGIGDNGSWGREYWKLTTKDGTTYYFGAGRRYVGDTGWTASTLNEPVFNNNPGEPCYPNWCVQTFRWNLDYVVDPRGNTMTYFYTRWGGAYGMNNGSMAGLYDMSSVLDHIDYGTRAGSEASTTAPMRVVFGKGERCPGSSCNKGTVDYPDTPWDLYCAPGAATCPGLTSPVYWSPWKLSTVTSQVLNGSAYRNVDRWDLGQDYPQSGDNVAPAGNDTSPNLWLRSITHTGYAANGVTAQAEPATVFDGAPRPNRKDWGNDLGVAPYMHFRLTDIRTGTGGETMVSYTGPDCSRVTIPTPDASNWRCFPQFFKPQTAVAGFGWFQKYIVTAVTERDLTGGSPDET